MPSENLRKAWDAAVDGKAGEPVILDITKLTPMADYFLVCSGQSTVHVKSIAEHLQAEMEKAGVKLLRKEGGQEAQWILLDYGWLVAHIMLERIRDFYQLERLWHDAENISFPVPALHDRSDIQA